MPDNPFARVTNAIEARQPLLYLLGSEEKRIEAILKGVSRTHYGDQRPVVQWTVTRGMYSGGMAVNKLTQPQQVLEYIIESGDDAIYLMKDLPVLCKQDPALIRKLRDVYYAMANRNATVVMSSPVLTLPEELKREVLLIEMGVASEKEIHRYLEQLSGSMDADTEIPEHWLQVCSNAMRGLSMNEVSHLFYTLKHNQSFDTESALKQIHKVKEQTLLKESCLKMVPNNLSLVHIGGLDNVKHWVTTRKTLFTAEARQSGIPLPSGVLFMGISGCGKSLAAKTIASAWDLQLVRLDMNLIMSGAFGSPELAFERATKAAESIAPVVLWIDEIENAFGYDQNAVTSGNLNVFGSFLTWMQEKPASVFLAATANRIALLPAEMIRRGRFDQVYFLDLPHASEREEIFRIHIAKNRGDTTQFNLPALAKLTEGWTGAEIEQAVNAARVHAFTSKKEFSSSQIFRSIGQSVPLSETMHEQINELRRWSFNRATPASSLSTYGK